METFPLFLYSWHVDDNEDGLIHMFGLTPENQDVHLMVNGFTPYVYMELPPGIDWNGDRREALLDAISSLDQEIQPRIRSFMKKKKIYFANVVKKDGVYEWLRYQYLFLSFKSRTVMGEFIQKTRYGLNVSGMQKLKPKFHEQDASVPLQYSCCRDIPITGWITVHGMRRVKDTESHCWGEYDVDWKDISSCHDAKLKTIIPCPKIMCFDLEANSSNIATMPRVNHPHDKIFQISMAVTRHGDVDEKREARMDLYLLSLGKPDPAKLDPGTILKIFECESDLLLAFSRMIVEINPQILVGYNILGWDFQYLIGRALYLGIYSEFTQFGCLKGVPSKKKEFKMSSNAFKNNTFVFLDPPGRVIVDMLPIIRREFKFSRYDLRSVSTEILGQTKDPLTHRGIFKCYRIFSPASLALVGKYCGKDSIVTLKLFIKLKTWVGCCQLSDTFRVTIIDLYTAGQQLRIYSQVYKYCIDHNIVVEKDVYKCGEDESYTGAIVLDPVPGMHEDLVIVDFASLYPSVMIADNICYSTLVNDDDKKMSASIPDEDCNIREWEDHISCPHDTTVYKTKPKRVVCAPRRYRFLKKPMGIIPTILSNLISERKKTNAEKKDVETRAKLEATQALILDLLAYAGVLDIRQGSLKIASNSMYGGMGVRKGKLPFMAGAMSTTAGGRAALLKIKNIFSTGYDVNVIYGDTDSLMMTFNNMAQFVFEGKLDIGKFTDYCKGICAEISKEFPHPMKLEFEVLCSQFLMLVKKKYAGIMDGGKWKRRGIMTSRRDNSPVARLVYETVMKMIFDRKPLSEVVTRILEFLDEICARNFPTKDFTVTKSIKEISEYKVKKSSTDPITRKQQFLNRGLDPDRHTEMDYLLKGLPAHVQLAERMRRRGALVDAGSRIDYIITRAGGYKAKIYEKIESTEYYIDHSSTIKLDLLYYVKSLVEPLHQLLEVAYKTNILKPAYRPSVAMKGDLGWKTFMRDQLDFRTNKIQALDELRSLMQTSIILK